MTRGFGLRAFVLVVREHEVVAAAVEIEAVAEDLERHRGALDVPTGSAGTPRRFPGRLPRLRGLPEREVDRTALLLVDLDARAGRVEQIIEVPTGELAVVVVAVDREVHAFALDHVRVTAFHQLRDQRVHLVDELGGVRHRVGTTDAEAVEVVPVRRR